MLGGSAPKVEMLLGHRMGQNWMDSGADLAKDSPTSHAVKSSTH